jgi:hypothetical protein
VANGKVTKSTPSKKNGGIKKEAIESHASSFLTDATQADDDEDAFGHTVGGAGGDADIFVDMTF